MPSFDLMPVTAIGPLYKYRQFIPFSPQFPIILPHTTKCPPPINFLPKKTSQKNSCKFSAFLRECVYPYHFANFSDLRTSRMERVNAPQMANLQTIPPNSTLFLLQIQQIPTSMMSMVTKSWAKLPKHSWLELMFSMAVESCNSAKFVYKEQVAASLMDKRISHSEWMDSLPWPFTWAKYAGSLLVKQYFLRLISNTIIAITAVYECIFCF